MEAREGAEGKGWVRRSGRGESIPAPSQGGGQRPGKGKGRAVQEGPETPQGRARQLLRVGGEASGAKTESWEHGETAEVGWMG